MLQSLFETHRKILGKLDNITYDRYLYKRIDWDSKTIAVVGSSGTGKTTMLLQYYQNNYKSPEECLYILADDLEVINLGLDNIVKEFEGNGGKILIIDEIHKYPNWSQHIKNIYDKYPKLKTIISGSATLNILRGKYDLSRRALTYKLNGLSFREFVLLRTKVNLGVYDLNSILDDHINIANNVNNAIEKSGNKILKLFKDYLKFGYYPFHLESKITNTYQIKVNNTIDKILYEDIPTTFNIPVSSLHAFQKLIFLIATSPPFVIDISSIAKNIGVSRESAYLYIDYLNQADIFLSVKPHALGSKLIRKPSKLYLNNPNLYLAINKTEELGKNIGVLRESFALNQLSVDHATTVADKGDFVIDGKYTFEIGGRGKDGNQVNGIDNSYLLLDDIEVGYGKSVPLCLLGLLY